MVGLSHTIDARPDNLWGAEGRVGRAEVFLKFDYAEVKDLCKHFLTLISAILVFSVTFSEKIINIERATLVTKVFAFASWGPLALSLLSCGGGLAFIVHAGWLASHRPISNVHWRSSQKLLGFLSAQASSSCLQYHRWDLPFFSIETEPLISN